MTEKATPHWQPITQLPVIAYLIDEMVADATEQYQNLQEARPKPYILDDHTIGRVIKVFTSQQNDLWLFEEQLQRWRAAPSGAKHSQELDRLSFQLERVRKLVKDILVLADELKEGTIEKMLAKSDIELGLEALLGRWPDVSQPRKGRTRPKKKRL